MGKQMVVCVLVPALAVSSCTAMQPRRVIHPDKPPLAGLKAGDTVEIEANDGRRQRFVIQAVQGDAILAPSGVRYLAADITSLKRKEFSPAKTILLVGGLSAGIYILASVALATLLDGVSVFPAR